MKKLNLSLLLLLSFCAGRAQTQPYSIQVLSATVKDRQIDGAEVIFQKNGAHSVKTVTGTNGNARAITPFADNNDATVIIKKPGYSTLVAQCPCNGLTYAISPVMQNLDGMRIVLTWGNEPDDLDAHLAYERQNIFYRNKNGDGANLDVDDIDRYGPETITIDQKKYGTTYVYAVHDFSERESPGSLKLSASRARVFVYIGESLVRSYAVPPHKAGNVWTVFKLDANGGMEDINTITGTTNDPGTFTYAYLSGFTGGGNDYTHDNTAARSYDAQGETAYHTGDFEHAVYWYQKAIDADPQYGQAYGNLGLAYKKMLRYAEAIWANRKALEFASGTTMAATRAGAYYNIGRIYEEKGQYANALRQYQFAREEKTNIVYDNAIQRMQSKL